MSKQRRRHTPEQIVRKLGQADRLPGEGDTVADACRELGVSEQTYYRWRNQYGGMKPDEAKRLKELEKAALKELAEGTSRPGQAPRRCCSPDSHLAGQ